MSVLDPTPDPHRDPRRCVLIAVYLLVIDERIQRELNSDKVATIVNEFTWRKFEPLTVAENGDGTYTVVEGQHRAAAMQKINSECFVWCVILDAGISSIEQAEVALGIAKGRSGHTAFESWRLCLNARHPHELAADRVLTGMGLRLGTSPSAYTIGAVATVAKIVKGGGKPPAIGAALLARTLDLALRAYPHDDRESCVTRWSREVLLSLSSLLLAKPDLDTQRLVFALRSKPAVQWINIGRGVLDRSPHEVLAAKLAEEYNRKLRTGRIEL